jgi:hypothetical protein
MDAFWDVMPKAGPFGCRMLHISAEKQDAMHFIPSSGEPGAPHHQLFNRRMRTPTPWSFEPFGI